MLILLTFCNVLTKRSFIFRETLRKEGVVRGLYAGTVPSLAANVAENSILFAAYGLCQKLVARSLSVEVANLSTFSNGCAGKLYQISSVFTLALKIPFVCMTRYFKYIKIYRILSCFLVLIGAMPN